MVDGGVVAVSRTSRKIRAYRACVRKYERLVMDMSVQSRWAIAVRRRRPRVKVGYVEQQSIEAELQKFCGCGGDLPASVAPVVDLIEGEGEKMCT